MSTAYANLPHITLIADPQVLSIPVHENHDTFVDLTKQKALVFGPSPEIPNNIDYTFIRRAVYEKLLEAQRQLPQGIYFCLYEGYRSIELQKMLFEKQYQNVIARHPDWSKADIFHETTKLVSPVINEDGSHNIPPHSTGAAIDVYLIDEQGKPLDMGIHPKDWMQDKDGVLSLTASPAISEEAQKNRHLMNTVLLAVGFANYPTEYWHWSYGDRYWAFMKKQPFAIYGSSSPQRTAASSLNVSRETSVIID